MFCGRADGGALDFYTNKRESHESIIHDCQLRQGQISPSPSHNLTTRWETSWLRAIKSICTPYSVSCGLCSSRPGMSCTTASCYSRQWTSIQTPKWLLRNQLSGDVTTAQKGYLQVKAALQSDANNLFPVLGRLTLRPKLKGRIIGRQSHGDNRTSTALQLLHCKSTIRPSFILELMRTVVEVGEITRLATSWTGTFSWTASSHS